MKRLSLNREFAVRHLGVAALMFGLFCWFGYDGLVKYPSIPAADLYRSIEGSDVPAGCDLDAFKRQKTQAQYGFAALALLAALVVGGHVALVARLRFEYDDDGFSAAGRPRRAFSDVRSVDWSKWKSKGIVRVDGVTLDAWHHDGVRDVAASLERAGKGPEAK